MQRLLLDEALREAPDSRMVLEVGCGDGRFLSAVGSAFPGSELVGVDISERQLGKARARLSSVPGVRLVLAAVEALPLPDQTFDLIVTNRSFHHWSDQLAGLREVVRVLKPEGVFVLADPLGAGLIRRPWVRRVAESLDGGRFIDGESLDTMFANVGIELTQRIPVPYSGGTLFISVGRLRASSGRAG